MADKADQQKEVESTEEVDKSKTEETPADEDSKSENGESVENGDQADKENGKGDEDSVEATDDTDKVCSVKRKSTGGGDASETATEGTPEKKAKLGETTEAESNGEAEVAA